MIDDGHGVSGMHHGLMTLAWRPTFGTRVKQAARGIHSQIRHPLHCRRPEDIPAGRTDEYRRSALGGMIAVLIVSPISSSHTT